MKISIIGLAKSGTTAIYKAINEGLDEVNTSLFEPKTRNELEHVLKEEGNSITKIMFTKKEECGYNPEEFDKNVFIVRDPRDIFISALLYRFNSSSFIENEQKYKRLLKLFENKEKNPKKVTILSILDEISKNESLRIFHAYANMFNEMITYLRKYKNNLFILRYEDFVDDNLDELSEYLGFKVNNEVELKGWVNKIQRKGTYGDWKNWFTKKDIDFFRASMEYFFNRFGYEKSWKLNSHPKIESKYCSEYIQRLVNEHNKDPMSHKKNITKELIENLHSAASDGKHIAMMQLAKIYRDGIDVKKDLDKALELYKKASSLGNINANYEAGKLLSKNNNIEALKYFLKAVELNHINSAYEAALIYQTENKLKDMFGLYLKGAELGSRSCMRKVADCYKKGLGTKINTENSSFWMNEYKKGK